MVDLDKPSHRRFAESWYARVLKPSAATRNVDRYFDLANSEEMRGNYKFADEIRRFAINSP